MIKICDHTICTGCGLCKSQCPVDAISMRPKNGGFLYPDIDSSVCISCGVCIEVCPANMKSPSSSSDIYKSYTAYVAYQTNSQQLQNCSAGGAASAISKSILKKGGIVFGVKYDKTFRKVYFDRATRSSEAEAFRGSKYIESDRTKLFELLPSAISTNSDVLVVGLPCDIAAVRSLVGYPDNLYTCMLICRGNTSLDAFNQWLDDCERDANSTISHLNLRYKESGYPILPTRYQICFENGTIRKGDFTKSDYGKAFQILSRYSCLHCRAKALNLSPDFIIGDYQGLLPEDPLSDVNGVSVVFCCSDKSKSVFNETSELYFDTADLRALWAYNWMIYTSIPESPFRERFLDDFVQGGLRNACHRLCVEQNAILDSAVAKYANPQIKVAVWGAGDTSLYLYERLQMDSWNIVAIFDGSDMKIGKDFKGHTIHDIKEISDFQVSFDILIVMIPSENESKLSDLLHNYSYSGKIHYLGKYKFYREEQ